MNRLCEKYFGLIEDLIEGEILDEQIAAKAEAHVSDCAECQSEYELLLREKEILAHYMFNFEPPPDSWTNFQTRLIEEETVSDAAASTARRSSSRKRRFVFAFSPAFAAGLILFLGVGFVLLKNIPFDTHDDRNIAETKPGNSLSPQPDEIDLKSVTNLPSGNITAASDAAAKNNVAKTENRTPSTKSTAPSGKKSFTAGELKTRRETASFGVRKKRENETATGGEIQAAALRKQSLENEIGTQIEKIELLLRSFRNARKDENAVIFDVEYEKRQARKLLEMNAVLRHDAETYGIAYAEELLNRVDSYLLEIANLGSNPSPEKVEDIKERISSQNIIAGLQVYNRIGE